ncbi:hypothetical protein AXF42_Ash012990 [Apostasia shenzhenica]|uniref:Uncharacterized protein n=1 Tax=Apostasia shenzhenica TaxID=1088818 RepID=A0A2I0ARU4_9ASPA|nr:hypothetical protein AXF42_Ash012990 [Apostasia shenzhenica]
MMERIRWCLVMILQSFIVSCVSLNHKDLEGIDMKVLHVAEELERETLLLTIGQRIYELHGLKESSWYEVKISYPASIPASFSLRLKNLVERQVSTSRRLLNTEKIMFQFHRGSWNSSENVAFVLLTVERAGIVAQPNRKEQEVVLFNIICEELLIGIPHRAWWVGIAGLLCLLMAAFIPYYFPLYLLQSCKTAVTKES